VVIREATTHQAKLKSPDTTSPKFDSLLSITFLRKVDLDAIPPAFALYTSLTEGCIFNSVITYRRFPPKQKQLLSRRHLVVVDGDRLVSIVSDAGLEKYKGDRRDTAARGFKSTESPLVLTVEATGR
jgi:hypothetical protein